MCLLVSRCVGVSHDVGAGLPSARPPHHRTPPLRPLNRSKMSRYFSLRSFFLLLLGVSSWIVAAFQGHDPLKLRVWAPWGHCVNPWQWSSGGRSSGRGSQKPYKTTPHHKNERTTQKRNTQKDTLKKEKHTKTFYEKKHTLEKHAKIKNKSHTESRMNPKKH